VKKSSIQLGQFDNSGQIGLLRVRGETVQAEIFDQTLA